MLSWTRTLVWSVCKYWQSIITVCVVRSRSRWHWFDSLSLLFQQTMPNCYWSSRADSRTVCWRSSLKPCLDSASFPSTAFFYWKCSHNGEEEDPDHPDRRREEQTGQCPLLILSGYCVRWTVLASSAKEFVTKRSAFLMQEKLRIF